MNTIPTTSKQKGQTYTVIGSGVTHFPKEALPVSVVILNRGERVFKESQFVELEKAGFLEIISIEPPDSFYDVESYTRRFKKMKFIVPQKELNQGEYINIAAQEASASMMLVLWNNMHLPPASYSRKIVARALESERLCTVPYLCSRYNEPLATMFIPAFYRKNRLKVASFQPSQSHPYTILPHDYCGLYNRQKFLQSGGFDPSVKSPWWQLMDFGLRSYMWGERFSCDLTFRVGYQQDHIAVDQSINNDYALFYLKNLAIRFKKDRAYLPSKKLFSHIRRSVNSFKKAWNEFDNTKKQVNKNRFRYIQSATSVVNLWENMQ